MELSQPVLPSTTKKTPVRFSANEDVYILKEVLAQNPFALSSRWEDIAGRMRALRPKLYSSRNVKERVEYLLKLFIKGEREILKKSGTEEEYSEREMLLEEVKSLKESTSVIPKGKRAMTDLNREEGKRLRLEAAASLPTKIPKDEMYTQEMIILDDDFLNTRKLELEAEALPSDLNNSPTTAPHNSSPTVSEAPQVLVPPSFLVNTNTPRSVFTKRKTAFNKAVMDHMAKKREDETKIRLQNIELEVAKTANETKKLELEECRLQVLTNLEKKVSDMDATLKVVVDNQQKITSMLQFLLNPSTK